MAEEANFGVRRLRQAITNQATCGSGQFELSIDSADKLCRECEDELARLAWAKGAPVPKDADGEVVPLTTEVMYDEGGEEVQVNHFRLAGHNVGDRLKWRVREMPGAVLDLDILHLHHSDSWERLEEDIRNAEKGGACGYYGREAKPCNERCPAYKDMATPCAAIALKDAVSRAKALAGRDAKEADRG